MNKLFISGRLGRNPDITTAKSGDMQIAKFSVAVDTGYGDKKKTSWINCVAFGKSATAIEKYIFKGSPITIEGHLQTGSYEKKDGTKVYTTDCIVDNWEFAMKDKNERDEVHPADDPDDDTVSETTEPEEFSNDGLPF